MHKKHNKVNANLTLRLIPFRWKLIFSTSTYLPLNEAVLLIISTRWGSFGSPNAMHKVVKMPLAYEMALNTWSDWLETHVNRSKTLLFFVSMSPSHEK